MFVIKWWRFLRGYLVINLRGRGVERLLNMAVVRGLQFWDLRRHDAGAQLKVSLSSFRQLRPLVRRSRCRLHIAARVGGPFWVKRMRRRWGLVAGAVFFCAALYLLSSYVWFIHVIGCTAIPPGEVVALVEQMGVRPGTWKASLNLYELEEELPRRHPDITWAGFRLRGTLLEIEIVEHIPEPVPSDSPGDMVAAKDGLVERVFTVEGETAVAPGTTVLQGDLLIRGVRTVSIPGSSGRGEEIIEPVRARGLVEARVWYEARTPAEESITVTMDTGDYSRGWYLAWPSGKLTVWGARKDPFDSSRQEVLQRLFRWRNLTLPVELIQVTYFELLHHEMELAPGEAIRLARREALHQVQSQLPAGVPAGQPFFEEYTADGKRWVLVVVETREDIAVFRPQQPD